MFGIVFGLFLSCSVLLNPMQNRYYTYYLFRNQIARSSQLHMQNNLNYSILRFSVASKISHDSWICTALQAYRDQDELIIKLSVLLVSLIPSTCYHMMHTEKKFPNTRRNWSHICLTFFMHFLIIRPNFIISILNGFLQHWLAPIFSPSLPCLLSNALAPARQETRANVEHIRTLYLRAML